MNKQSMPFGLWPSPVTPEMLGAKLRLEDVQFDTDGETLLWLEGRDGHGVLVAQRGDDAPRDFSAGVDVRAGVGYGGGDFTVRDGQAVFAARGRLYAVALNHGAPRPITPAFGDAASPVISPDGTQILFVHTYERSDCLGLAAMPTAPAGRSSSPTAPISICSQPGTPMANRSPGSNGTTPDALGRHAPDDRPPRRRPR
jgi:hypothetical protein